MSTIRHRITYANVVATLALFVALGGTAYATATIGTSQIIDNSIASVDLKNREVKRVDLQDAVVDSTKIAAKVLPYVDQIRYRSSTNGDVTTLYDDANVTITGRCYVNSTSFKVTPKAVGGRYAMLSDVDDNAAPASDIITHAGIPGTVEVSAIASGHWADMIYVPPSGSNVRISAYIHGFNTTGYATCEIDGQITREP